MQLEKIVSESRSIDAILSKMESSHFRPGGTGAKHPQSQLRVIADTCDLYMARRLPDECRKLILEYSGLVRFGKNSLCYILYC